ncbi:MAG: hypothetical protein H3C30_05135 [Candidatus Hydrogenedentes bacterium]|nr:hypothetical protein [Candidatus Hydrogenedentota bacterium]
MQNTPLLVQHCLANLLTGQTAEPHKDILARFQEDILPEFFGGIFQKPLKVFFDPINHFLSQFYQPYATIFAVGFFVLAMIWVGVVLPEHYVNRGRPQKRLWSDLRLWTVISMLPHVAVYLYFR